MGSREPVPGEFREIFTRVVWGWGQSSIVRTLDAPIQGAKPERVLGCLLDSFRVDSAALDARAPRVVRLRGSMAAHVWYMGPDHGVTHTVDVRLPFIEEISWNCLEDGRIEAPDVRVTVVSGPVCNWARPQVGSVKLEAEVVIRIELVDFAWLCVRAAQPGLVSSDDTQTPTGA